MGAASIFRDYALPYIGLSNPNLLPKNASTRMMQALNAALQELLGEQQDKQAFQVRAAQQVTIGQVTASSKLITFAGFEDWMLGCTVLIGGDGLQNQFVLDGSAVSLLAPYQGSTQSNVTATVYQDVINTTSEIKQVFPPALLNHQYHVEPLPSRRALEDSRTIWRDDANTVPKIVRRPCWYTLEDNLAYFRTPTTRIVFDSLPDTSYVLTFEAIMRAPRVCDWSDTRDFFIPGQDDESILFPIALQRFMAWPQFLSDQTIRAQVAQDAQAARLKWGKRSHGFTHTAVDVTSY